MLETRLHQAQAEPMAPIDLISCLVADELTRRSERLLDRRRKQAAFRDPHKTLDNFDFTFNPKMNRSLAFDLATCAFIDKREDALFLGPGGAGKSHLAQAIGQAAIQQGYRVLYRETHVLLDDLAEAVADGTRKEFMESVATVPLLIIDDFGMRKLPLTAAEDLLEIIMRRYERASTLLTSNRLCGAPHKRFNAESTFMRTRHARGDRSGYFSVFSLRIIVVAFSSSSNLSVALKRPVRSFGAITDSNASSFTLGSARV